MGRAVRITIQVEEGSPLHYFIQHFSNGSKHLGRGLRKIVEEYMIVKRAMDTDPYIRKVLGKVITRQMKRKKVYS